MYDEILPGYAVSAFLQTEKSGGWNPATRRSYANCLQDLLRFAQSGPPLTPQRVAQWLQGLQQRYAPSTVNVHLAAANAYFRWCGRPDLLTTQPRKPGAPQSGPSPTLTRAEYIKLLCAARARGKHRSYLLVKVFAVSDMPLQCLDQLTVELLHKGEGPLRYRGSTQLYWCPAPLRQELLAYAAQNGVYRGPVFVTAQGQPLDRVHIFRSIQELCPTAHVPEEKGNPRALRNLYKTTQAQVEHSLDALRRQMCEQLLALEQDTVAWPTQTAGQGHPA